MTDERADLWRSVARLPRGAGIVFRHYRTSPAERRRIFLKLALVARQRALILVRAGAAPLPGERGVHGRRRGHGLRTFPAHDRAEAMRAARLGADALFVSPVFATRSHPGARPLGPIAARRLVAGLRPEAIALGGMDAKRFRGLARFHGWAAIDAWTRPLVQKRKAVPR